MTATFGRLDHARLDLHEGLNIITAPNEAGKSTWAAFLLAMLYGVDTSERATKTSLPDKTRYLPWSGAPMEGRLELCWQGRELTIERTSSGRGVFSGFRAFDAAGQDAGLSAAACGQTLLGVERSVYERSGFIRQQAMTLTGDRALEARLEALVTSGGEGIGYTQAQQRLRELLSRCCRPRTGRLPQTEAALQEAERQLEHLRQLGAEILELEARRSELEAALGELEAKKAAQQARANAEMHRKLLQARQDWERNAAALAEKERTVEHLPPLETLQDLLRELDVLAESAKTLEADLSRGIPQPDPPSCPPVFSGLSPEEVRQKAETDAAEVARLQAAPRWMRYVPGLLLAAAAVCLAAGGICLLQRLVLPAAAGLLFGVAAAAAALLCRRRLRAAKTACRQLLKPYGAGDPAGIYRAANDCREALLLYAEKTADAAEAARVLEARRADLANRRACLLEQVAAFAPENVEPATARAAVQRAVYLRQFHAAALRETAQAETRYQALAEAAGPAAAASPSEPEETAAGDPAETGAQLAAVRRELEETLAQLHLRQGRMEAAGDPAALAARQEALAGEAGRLQRRASALQLALDALDQANGILQTRVSPRLNRLAGQYLSRLTGGRYEQVLLRQDLTASARQSGEVASRPVLSLSAGTADQIYLAVRLAICQLALPPEAPLVLDDALAVFDDARMGAAMELLTELSAQRQILLFTCHHRERRWLEAHRKEQPHAQ